MWLLAAGAILVFAVMDDAVAAGPAVSVHGEYREFSAGLLSRALSAIHIFTYKDDNGSFIHV